MLCAGGGLLLSQSGWFSIWFAGMKWFVGRCCEVTSRWLFLLLRNGDDKWYCIDDLQEMEKLGVLGRVFGGFLLGFLIAGLKVRMREGAGS